MTKFVSIGEMLHSHPFVEGFSERILEKLGAIAREVEFAADEIIFQEGDGKDTFYLIVSGSVALEIKGPARTLRVQVLSEGEEIGWSSALPHSRKYFQARALKRVRALAFEGADLRALCEEDFELGYRFTHSLLGVVAQRLHVTQLQLVDVLETPGGRQG